MADGWTPGPWSHAIGEGRKYRISQKWGDSDGERKVIAQVIGEENAALMALAPEMAEALHSLSEGVARLLTELDKSAAGSDWAREHLGHATLQEVADVLERLPNGTPTETVPQRKITMTAKEILNAGHWDDFCDMRGWNLWIISEGRMDSSEEVTLTWDEAKRLGLV